MKICDFLQSYDIANHYKEIVHGFNALEQADIINRSRRTVQQKIEAWEELLNATEDILFIPNSTNRKALYERLQKIVEYFRNGLDVFTTPGKDEVYWTDDCR